MDSIKLGKAIKGLECCRRGFCFACPYNDGVDGNTECKQKWADDVLALLKEQELPDVKPEKLEEKTTKWLDQMTAEERLKEIAAILDDWDGYRTAKGLGGLINEIWAYALYPVKAQEPVKPFFSSDRRWLCGNCMREVEKYGGDYYCPGCGRKLLWE